MYKFCPKSKHRQECWTILIIRASEW